MSTATTLDRSRKRLLTPTNPKPPTHRLREGGTLPSTPLVARPCDTVPYVTRLRFNRRLRSAIGLLVLSPLIAEFLLGNQPITQLGGLIVLAPVYGGAAILIREITRRTGRGWPTILLLSAAYSLILEGLIDQMLFNPAYLGLQSFEGFSRIPGLGVSASITQATLTLHTIWSICVPIALVEAFEREPKRPWFGRFGLTVMALVFIAGSIVVTIYNWQSFHFMATLTQLTGTAIAIAMLCVAAFVTRRRPESPVGKPAPTPRRAGVASFGFTSVYCLESTFLPDNSVTEWLGVGAWFVLVGAAAALLLNWSRRHDWTDVHRLALAGGALLTYVWFGFVHGDYLSTSKSVIATGNILLGAGAIILLVTAVRAQRQQLTPGHGAAATPSS
jgi:hypothetical protein